MSPPSQHRMPPYRRDPISIAALIVALVALFVSLGGQAPAERQRVRPHGRAGGPGAKLAKLKVVCPVPDAVDLGTWCLEAEPHVVPPEDAGKNNYFYAAQICVDEGGWLPSAAQLIGAAPKVKLESTINDSPATSLAEENPNPENGIKDKREMTGDLFTVTAGSDAAGSEGVSPGSRGKASIGEPDPTPAPANPAPETLDYVTVYDNHNLGGFAGGEPISKPENFRCAFAKGSQTRKSKRIGEPPR